MQIKGRARFSIIVIIVCAVFVTIIALKFGSFTDKTVLFLKNYNARLYQSVYHFDKDKSEVYESQDELPTFKTSTPNLALKTNSILRQTNKKTTKGFTRNTLLTKDTNTTVSNKIPTSNDKCMYSEVLDTFDCYPDSNKGLSKDKCLARGCCWRAYAGDGVPQCYFPKVFPHYKVTKTQKNTFGFSSYLTRDTPSSWPNDIKNLRLDVTFESSNIVRIKIYDEIKRRFEVPLNVSLKQKEKGVSTYNYDVDIKNDPFSLTVTRKSNKRVIFSSYGVAPLIFSDQFIQFSSQLPSVYAYGLGESRTGLMIDLNWSKRTFWAYDHPIIPYANSYGVHPFYLSIEDKDYASGVFLLNSNAMQVDFQLKPALTYRTTGGVLDFFVFLGPSSDNVIQQYTNVIGRPALPPFWSLGFHLCRWGYSNSTVLNQVIKRMRAANMPYDTQWNDIDYMANKLDFTYDLDKYKDLPTIIKDLHDNGQHYVPIVDVGISSVQPSGTYPPYDSGLKESVFIMKPDGSSPLVGKVWPGLTVFPDFFNNKTVIWWEKQIRHYYGKVPIDGMWIDMNEPSNFVNGSVDSCPKDTYSYPPFSPRFHPGSIFAKTLCPSARQAVSTHYNLHNLYGHSEAHSTHLALQNIRGKRSFVISRSTFASTGQFSGHWSGDNYASWTDLQFSIPEVLSFQMFGIPLVGADVCGFGGTTTAELCTRWMQLGAFYPFMRNHNYIKSPDQDPAAFDHVTKSYMRKALLTRYELLPFLYTLFYHSHTSGSVVAKPLFFNYPSDFTFTIDRQFMWGNDLLISPVLEEGSTNVTAFIPNGMWYDFYTGKALSSQGKYLVLDAPIDTINIHIRAGAIIPTLPPQVTTTLMRLKKFKLIVALSVDEDSYGELFWDDGEELDVIDRKHYAFISFHSLKASNTITTQVLNSGYSQVTLGSARILGVLHKPVSVVVNENNATHIYDDKLNTLYISDFAVDLLKPLKIVWK